LRPFVQSNEIVGIINLADYYHKRPSEILGIQVEYDAYCFDEACMFISLSLSEGKTPHWHRDVNSLHELYGKFDT
jgi:hypothetical protein